MRPALGETKQENMMAPPNIRGQGWQKPDYIETKSFICGYCGDRVSSDRGYKLNYHGDGSGQQVGGAYICPSCLCITMITPDGGRFPGHVPGSPVKYLPPDIGSLFDEARRSASQNCFTATAMICRKILMNTAVERGAKPNQTFLEYVNYLSEQGYIPPNGKHWVEHIRKKGNEATHEIILMKEKDATELLFFIEMLLRFVHEFPNMIPREDPKK